MRFLALAALLTSVSSYAVAQEKIDLPVPSTPLPGSFMLGGFATADDWQFMMGPSGAPDMVARMIKANPDGQIGFICRRKDGFMQIAIGSPKFPGKVGDTADFTVRVSDVSNLLHMEIRSEPLKDRPAVWESDGIATAAILEAIGTSPVWRRQGIAFTSSTGETLEFPLISQRPVALHMAQICRGWQDAILHPTVQSQDAPSSVSSAMGVGEATTVEGDKVVLPGLPGAPAEGVNPNLQR